MNVTATNNVNSAMVQQSVSMQMETNAVEDFDAVLQSAIKSGESEEIREAAVKMEGFFLYAVMREMRRTIPEPQGIFERSSAEKMMQDMLDKHVAIDIAESGGVGLGDMLYKQLSREANA